MDFSINGSPMIINPKNFSSVENSHATSLPLNPYGKSLSLKKFNRK